MKKRCGILFLFFPLCSLIAQPSPGAKTNVLVLTHATVIDATGAPARPEVTVVITGDRITALGNSADITPPAAAEIVDATGKFLIPGLWDMHVHWQDKDYLPLFTANGVTGIRIMWGQPFHHEWRKEIEQGTLPGPRMLIASTIVDGPKPLWPTSIAAGNELEGRQAVSQARRDGADFVKVYSALPRDVYFAIAAEAKKQKIPFEGHVPVSVSVEEASAAGQKTIEHLTGILPACSSREAELLKSGQEILAAFITTGTPESFITNLRPLGRLALETYSPARAAAVFAELKTNHTWQCPTLTVLHNIAFIDEPAITEDPRLKYLPRGFKEFWNPANDTRFKARTPDDVALARKIYQKNLELTGALQRAGVGILAGTDTANPYCFPGFSLHDELGLLVQSGLTPMEALQSATRNPARFMDREQELGTIEPGKLADLVLLDANPLDDIANTRKIRAVICGGRLSDRSALDGLLARIESLAKKKSAAETLLETIREKDVDAAIEQYRQLKSAPSTAAGLSEETLNGVGYSLIGLKRTGDAIRILKLNVEAYPQSANVYDSLGEAYMINGEKELAAENYRRSLQLDPQNINAVEKLKQLKVP